MWRFWLSRLLKFKTNFEDVSVNSECGKVFVRIRRYHRSMWQRIGTKLRAIYQKLRLFLLVIAIAANLVLGWALASQPLVSDDAPALTRISPESVPIISDLNTAGVGEATPGGQIEAKVQVSITGEVVKPGVYTLDPGAIVQDLLTLAEGFTPDADSIFTSRELNLARRLESGEQIYIPSTKEASLLPPVVASGSGGASSDKSPAQGLVNLNTASQSELETLAGVGPSTAQKIIAARPFAEVEDLLSVSGIGDATFNKLKDQVTI